MIKGDDGEYLSEKIDTAPPKIFNEDGTVNPELYEYLNSLPPTTKSYTELMKEIERAKVYDKFHETDKR